MNKRTRMMLLGGGKDRDVERERRERDYRNMPRYEYDTYVESKFRDRKGREHYDNGRYAPVKSEYGGYDGRWYPDYPTTVPPMYNRYDGGEYPVNKIGFSLEGEMERMPEMNPDYREDAEYRHMDEMKHRTSDRQGGYAEHRGSGKITREMAERWMAGIENTDGTHGAHWNMEQSKQVMAQRGIECDPVEFWVALNAMYSDYAMVAKELGVNTIDFYAKMAKAFLDDEDAMPNKLTRYYEHVVKH